MLVSSVSFSPNVIYILSCARCFLAALVYLPRTTASLCLPTRLAAFGVLSVFTQSILWSMTAKRNSQFPWGFVRKYCLFSRSESFSRLQLFPVGCPLRQWMALSLGRTSLSALESHSLVILASDWPTLSQCQRCVKNLGGGAQWKPVLAASVSLITFLFTEKIDRRQKDR